MNITPGLPRADKLVHIRRIQLGIQQSSFVLRTCGSVAASNAACASTNFGPLTIVRVYVTKIELGIGRNGRQPL